MVDFSIFLGPFLKCLTLLTILSTIFPVDIKVRVVKRIARKTGVSPYSFVDVQARILTGRVIKSEKMIMEVLTTVPFSFLLKSGVGEGSFNCSS